MWFFLINAIFLFALSKICIIFALAIRKETFKCKGSGALVQLVRIRACHARGQGFESPTHRTKKTIERLSSFFVYIYLSRALLIKSTSLQIDILSRVQAPANLSICNIALQFSPRELNLSWRRLLKLLGGVSSVVFIRTAHRRLRHSFADDALKRDIRVPNIPQHHTRWRPIDSAINSIDCSAWCASPQLTINAVFRFAIVIRQINHLLCVGCSNLLRR